MSVAATSDLQVTSLFTPRTVRDPVGMWASGLSVAMDASGGLVSWTLSAPADVRNLYIFNIMAAVASKSGGVAAAARFGARFLANVPPSSAAGLGSYELVIAKDSIALGSAVTPDGVLLPREWQFLPIWDPFGQTGVMDILVMTVDPNIDGEVAQFNAVGYYWHREAHRVEGGLRWPGSA